jgi:glycosyltransferase involved in cell wall biosynthesis
MVDVERDVHGRELAERTGQLLTDDVARWRCAEAGRRRAAEYDWPQVTQQVLRIYDELIENGGHPAGEGAPP